VAGKVKGFTQIGLIRVEVSEYDAEIDYLRLFRHRYSSETKRTVEELIKSHINTDSIRVFPMLDCEKMFVVYLDWGIYSKYLPTVCYTYPSICMGVLGFFMMMAGFALLMKLILI